MIKSNDLIVKSNSLVEARYKFTIWEVRVFAKMVTMIKKNDKEFAHYKIDIKDLMEFFGTKSHNDYQRIREVPSSLMDKKMRIPYVDSEGKKKILIAPLIAGAIQPNDNTLKEGNTSFELTFHPDLKQHLLELKKKLLQYDIKNVLRISSVHSVRIYELLKQYERIGKRVFEIEELKAILGIAGKYKRYNNFKKRIIDQAEKDLKEHTDIYFTVKSLKKGRSVYAIEFRIYENKANKAESQDEPKLIANDLFSPTGISISEVMPQTEENIGEVVLLLTEVGITPDMAMSLVECYGAKNVKNELKYANETLKTIPNVKSETGFIIRMIENQTFTELQKYKDAQLDKAQEIAKVQEKKRASQESRIRELRFEYTQVRNQAVNISLKGKNKKYIKTLVDKCAQEKPFIKKAIERAEGIKDKATADDFKYLLLAKKLSEEKFHNFDAYLSAEYELKLQRDERGEYLVQC